MKVTHTVKGFCWIITGRYVYKNKNTRERETIQACNDLFYGEIPLLFSTSKDAQKHMEDRYSKKIYWQSMRVEKVKIVIVK